MAIKTVTYFKTLMQLASKQVKAEQKYKSDPTEENKAIFEKAKEEHENYRQLCLKSDEMIVQESW